MRSLFPHSRSLQRGWLSILFASLSFACSFPARSQVLPFEFYTTATGLLSDGSTMLYQDSDGYLHVGSSEGLSTFDGYSFRYTRTKEGLPSNFINSINELPSFPGTLWLGTNNGLARIDHDSVTTLLPDTTALSRLVYSVEEDLTGQIWCATRGGLYTIRNAAVSRVPLPREIRSTITVLRVGADSLIWVPVDNLLLAFTSSHTISRSTLLSPDSTVSFSSAFRDRNGRVWIALTDSSIVSIVDGAIRHKRIIPGSVRYLMEDKQGELHIGTNEGVFSVEMETFPSSELQFTGPENGLPARPVTGGIVDREGDFWYSTDGLGIARLKTEGLLEFRIPDMSAAYNNMRATCDTAGHYWVISGSGLVEVFRDPGGTWRTERHQIRSNEPPSGIVLGPGNTLWLTSVGRTLNVYAIGYTSGRSVLKPRSVIREGSLHTRPRIVAAGNDNRVWITDSTTLNLRNTGSSREFSLTDLVGENDIRTVFEDSRGNVWVGGFSGGVAMVPPDGPARRYSPPGDIPAGFIRAFSEDRLGRIWIGTRYSGCMILDGEVVTTLSTRETLPSDAVWTISRDSAGLMWLGTTQGLTAIDPVTLQPDPIGNDLVREVVVSSGTSPDGTLWYVTPSGLGLIDRSKLRPPQNAVDVRLVRLEVNGRRVGIDHSQEFRYDENNWVFSFLASTLRNTRGIVYQYRLANVDPNWQLARDRTVAYASLSPGSYTFEVRATRTGADEYGNPASLSFTIDPPFWEQWWFRGTGALLCTALVFAVYRKRVDALEREKQTQQGFSRRLMESQENERKRIAGELHDSLVQNLLLAKNRSLMGLRSIDDRQRVRDELDQISGVLSSAIDEVRDIAHNLRPYQLDHLGFSKAVRSLVSRLAESTPIRFSENIEDVDSCLADGTGIQAYRILQEALNNVVRHSGASSASVTLRRAGETVELVIRDDGKGAANAGNGTRGFGLDGMEQRARLIGGTFAMSSTPGEGTTIIVTIPLQER